MKKADKSKLLKIPEVVEEIKRHLWIESEKAGYDIGFEKAANDWIEKYAAAWLKYFHPDKPAVKRDSAPKTKKKVVKKAVKKTTKKRSAKSYS